MNWKGSEVAGPGAAVAASEGDSVGDGDGGAVVAGGFESVGDGAAGELGELSAGAMGGVACLVRTICGLSRMTLVSFKRRLSNSFQE
jgi:hypothetical protein